MSNRQKRLEKAQIRVMFQAPFFAPGVARLPVTFDPSVPTACTDGKEIRWGTEFFDKLQDHELVTVLCHEVCHAMLGHLWRFSGKDADIANQACDHAVNLMLKEFSALVVKSGKADPFPFPGASDSYLADPRFAGMAEEQIYGILAAGPKNPAGGAGATAGAGNGSSPAGSNVPTSSNKTRPGSNAGVSSSSKPHSMPSFGQFTSPQAAAPGSAAAAQAKREASDWQNTLIQAVAMAKGQGNIPGSLSRLVDGIVCPKVPWPSLLRNWLREQCADDWCFSTPDLCMAGSGFILPSLRSDKMGSVVFGSDWSGSTHEYIGLFHAEKQAALDDMRPAKLIDIGFDTEIGWEREYSPGDTIAPEVKCGGGTCFKAFFARCDDMHPVPKCVVVLTDLDGSFPDEAPGYPVLWVCTERDGKAPFGQVVYAGD